MSADGGLIKDMIKILISFISLIRVVLVEQKIYKVFNLFLEGFRYG